jgi:CheY-like chemotaxis protein
VPLKILLADKNMTAQKLGQKILTDAGHEVIAVSNGAAAVKRIAEHKPDLLLLDVFMPGYSGTEVCAKVRGGAEGAETPVLLTVAQMEHFDPADAEKVKADGVIVKPFVAKDLEELVAKIEEKLKAAPAAPAARDTVKMEAFQDASYEEWKVTADDHVEEEVPVSKGPEVPEEMAGASAFGDMLGEEVSAPAAEVAAPPAPPAQEAPAAEVALEPYVASEPAPPPPAPEPQHEVEFTSAPKAESVEVHGKDPALITDATEMASAFPTKFGVEGAEEVPVGVAADMPELYTDSQAPAEAPEETVLEEDSVPTAELSSAEVKRITQEIPAPAPEAVEVAAAPAESPDSAEAARSLEQEMAQAFANVPVDTQPPADEPLPPPAEAAPPASSSAENAPDPLLAAAMSAAVGGTPPTVTLDANTIANIVHKVTERMKPELISEIAKELAAEAERAARKP